jgi:hypothetical protein
MYPIRVCLLIVEFIKTNVMKNILFLPLALIGFVFFLIISVMPDPVKDTAETKTI